VRCPEMLAGHFDLEEQLHGHTSELASWPAPFRSFSLEQLYL
jgi:hypothetical protein